MNPKINPDPKATNTDLGREDIGDYFDSITEPYVGFTHHVSIQHPLKLALVFALMTSWTSWEL